MRYLLDNLFRITFTLSILFCAYLLYSVYKEVEQDTIEQLNVQLKSQANLVTEGISQFIEAQEADLKFLSNLPAIINVTSDIDLILSEYYKNHSERIKAITRIDSVGKILYTQPFVESAIGRDVSFQEHNKFIIENKKPLLSDVFMAVQGYRAIAYAYPVFKDSVYLGCISLLIPFDYLAETYVSNIKVGETGYGWIISEEGVEIYCPFPGHTGKQVRDMLNNSESLEKIIDLAEKQIAGYDEYYQTDFSSEKPVMIKKFSYHEPILLPNTFWTIIVTAPETEVFMLMRGFRNNFVIIIIVFALGIGGFSYIYHKRKLRNAETIREEKELYSRIGEETGLVFYEYHIKSGRMVWGGALESTLGFSKEDLSSVNITDWEKLIHPKDKDKVISSLNKAIEQKTNLSTEYRFTTKNGKYIYIENNGILLNAENPSTFRLVGLMKDISNRKRIEKKLKRSKTELEQLVKERTTELNEKNLQLASDLEVRRKIEVELRMAKEAAEVSDRLKSEFLAQMSHEIRTPVSTIMNFTSLLKMELDSRDNEDKHESFVSIENAANRLIRTIDLILNLSDIEAGTYKPHFQNLSLSKDIIDPIINEFSVKAASKNLKLIFNSAATYNIHNIDRYTVTQIFANLIDNAIKYTNEGNITVKLTEQSEHLICEVIDTGIGISESYLPEIFKVFTQEEQGYTRRYDGSGLGLALVKKYCEINNIDIWVKSEKGVGSTFGLKIKKI